MTYLIPSLRLWLVTLLVCVVGYSLFVLAFAQSVAPFRANGSIITIDGRAVGSELVAQNFTSARYFWPRPSAADYDAMGAAGSNLSPTSETLAKRAAETVPPIPFRPTWLPRRAVDWTRISRAPAPYIRCSGWRVRAGSPPPRCSNSSMTA